MVFLPARTMSGKLTAKWNHQLTNESTTVKNPIFRNWDTDSSALRKCQIITKKHSIGRHCCHKWNSKWRAYYALNGNLCWFDSKIVARDNNRANMLHLMTCQINLQAKLLINHLSSEVVKSPELESLQHRDHISTYLKTFLFVTLQAAVWWLQDLCNIPTPHHLRHSQHDLQTQTQIVPLENAQNWHLSSKCQWILQRKISNKCLSHIWNTSVHFLGGDNRMIFKNQSLHMTG